MRAKLLIVACALASLLLGVTSRLVEASPVPDQSKESADTAFRSSLPESGQAAPVLQPGSPFPYYIYAESTEEEDFWTQNRETINNILPTWSSIPHLVLYRSDRVTDTQAGLDTLRPQRIIANRGQGN